MLIKMLEPDFVFENEAGSLKQLVHDGWKQVNVITSVGGAVRGGRSPRPVPLRHPGAADAGR